MSFTDQAVSHLAAWADPAHAVAVLGPALRVDTVERLLRTPRTASRTAQVLLATLRAGPLAEDSMPGADRALLLASPADHRNAAMLAGAVWHAPRVRALVSARDVGTFVERHGAATRDAALRHQALAPKPDRADAGTPLDELIERDGLASLAAWAAALPEWAARWLHLVGGPKAQALAGPAQARAVAIIRAVAPA